MCVCVCLCVTLRISVLVGTSLDFRHLERGHCSHSSVVLFRGLLSSLTLGWRPKLELVY